MTLVSVIIPTFNRAELVVQTLESVLAQSYRRLEVIIVDNGSTDDTLARLAPFADQIIICHEPKPGMGGSYARNRGLEQATGDYIAFLDSDDLWHPEKLSLQMELLLREPELAWCYTDSEVFNDQTKKTVYAQSNRHTLHEGDILKSLFMKNFVHSITPVIRKDVFEKVGVFYPLPKSTDWDMMLRIAAKYPIKLVPKVLASVRQHSNNVTTTTSGSKAVESSQKVIERIVSQNPQLEPFKAHALAKTHIANGLLLAKSGFGQKARQSFKQAIRLQPADWPTYLYWLSAFLPQPLLEQARQWRQRSWHSGGT